MTFVVVQNIDVADAPPRRSGTALVPKRPRPTKGVGSAWTAWKTDGVAAARSKFLESVSSWTEGTAAQLLRPPWPAQTERPTSLAVEERLREMLGLAVGDEHSNYRDALDWARRAVIEELRQARSVPAPPAPPRRS
jgi:hypothetical protein